MKVSVCIITYNHAKYIAEAIEGVLAQKTNFDFEIIVGEDDSTDNTREIVKAYREQYPDRIRLFLNERKNVIYIDGKPTGRWNFMNNIRNAKGDYIALLDGDDYWTSPDKLQKQADFLDSHPECAMCFHDVRIVFEDNSQPSWEATPPGRKIKYTLKDLIKGNFIYTCSVMFRRGLFHEFPSWFSLVAWADWPLHILNAEHGDIGHIPEVMGTYRIRSEGILSSKKNIDKVKDLVGIYPYINAHLNFRYDKLIRAIMLFKIVEKRISQTRGCGWIVKTYRKLFFHKHLR
jgi:glycosyltransferase involved in cell wall biosynthesis